MVAMDPRNALARVHGLLHTALDGDDGKRVGWMPAHLTQADLALGRATKSDGSPVRAVDIWANDVADRLAKLGAEYHRVPAEEVKRWKAAFTAAKARAKWIGIATHAAGNHAHFPYRDSEASRWKAVAAQRRKADKKAGIDGRRKRGSKAEKKIIPAAKGGHHVELAMSGHCWICTKCKARSTSRLNLATSKCGGIGVKPLAMVAAAVKSKPAEGGRRHVLIEAGSVQWCDICGTYAESRTSKRMAGVCLGPPPAAAGKGGMRQQLMALKAGKHPVTGYCLPSPSGNVAPVGNGTYAMLKPTISYDDSFVPYVPEQFGEPQPAKGESAERKRWLLLGRLRCKQGMEERRRKRLRRKEAKSEVRELIRSFCDDGADALATSESMCEAAADDASDEEFWKSLPSVIERERHVHMIPTNPCRQFPGKAIRSRLEALKQAAVHYEDVSLGECCELQGSFFQHADATRVASL